MRYEPALLAERERTTTLERELRDAIAATSVGGRELAVEYQMLVAAREATSKEMIPEKYRHLTPAELSQRIEELRVYIR